MAITDQGQKLKRLGTTWPKVKAIGQNESSTHARENNEDLSQIKSGRPKQPPAANINFTLYFYIFNLCIYSLFF